MVPLTMQDVGEVVVRRDIFQIIFLDKFFVSASQKELFLKEFSAHNTDSF